MIKKNAKKTLPTTKEGHRNQRGMGNPIPQTRKKKPFPNRQQINIATVKEQAKQNPKSGLPLANPSSRELKHVPFLIKPSGEKKQEENLLKQEASLFNTFPASSPVALSCKLIPVSGQLSFRPQWVHLMGK